MVFHPTLELLKKLISLPLLNPLRLVGSFETIYNPLLK